MTEQRCERMLLFDCLLVPRRGQNMGWGRKGSLEGVPQPTTIQKD